MSQPAGFGEDEGDARVHPGVSPAAPRPCHGKIVWDSYAPIPGGVCISKIHTIRFFPKIPTCTVKKKSLTFIAGIRGEKSFFDHSLVLSRF